MLQFFKSVGRFISKYKIGYIIVAIGLIIMAWYTVTGIMAGKKSIESLNTSLIGNKVMAGNEDEHVFELRRQNAFLKNRLQLSKLDSVSLIINLKDSVVMLDLKGVTIHRSKIINFSKSSLFDNLHPQALLGLFSKPLQVKSSSSTIVKKVLIHKKAPKDTIEAALAEEVVDTMAQHMPSVHILHLTHDVVLSITHDVKDGYSYLPFIREQKIEQFNAATDSLVKFSLPNYSPTINIEMNKEDATTIFRAIPHYAYVAIHF